MKLQISFDMTDLNQALDIAEQIVEHVDIIEVGTLLIYSHGSNAVTTFKKKFPQITILADCKIADRGKETAQLFAKAEADWITVMAGTSKDVIHAACTAAHKLNKKVMLDLIDASSVSQSALEAKNLGADALLFHQPYDEQDSLVFLDKWEMIKGNATLPIYISAKINRNNISDILSLKPHGILIGNAITEAEDPKAEAAYFYSLAKEY